MKSFDAVHVLVVFSNAISECADNVNSVKIDKSASTHYESMCSNKMQTEPLTDKLLNKCIACNGNCNTCEFSLFINNPRLSKMPRIIFTHITSYNKSMHTLKNKCSLLLNSFVDCFVKWLNITLIFYGLSAATLYICEKIEGRFNHFGGGRAVAAAGP